MMAKSHMMFGGACWAAYSLSTNQVIGIEVVGAVAASLLPDIDHPNSKAGRLVPFISYPISAIFGHRGITHSFIAIVGMVTVLYYYGLHNIWITAVIIGYLSHILGDWLTGGVPLLWPHSKRFSSPVTIRTNSILEPVLVAGLLISLVFVSNYLNPGVLNNFTGIMPSGLSII